MFTASRPSLRRLLRLDQMIRSGGYPNASTVARELEVHPRTIHRDLQFLRDSWGAPVEFSPHRNGFFYRDPDFTLPLLRLTEGELIALFLAERLMEQYQHGPIVADLARAFHKLTAALPDEVTIDLSHLAEAFSCRTLPVSKREVRVFRQLVQAVRQGRQLELTYWTASRNETCQRVVDPYHLVAVGGEWYLAAHCHLREEVRLFVPGRIRKLRETGFRFERPADFSINDFLDASFRVVRGQGQVQEVRLQFTPEAARYVREKTWHPSQQLQNRADGSLVLTFQLDNLFEVKRWLLSWGGQCKVLAPPELRRQVQEELRQMHRQYE